MSEVELRTDEAPLDAVRRVLDGADEALLCVAFVQERGVNLLDRQLLAVPDSRLVVTTVFGSSTRQGLDGAARRGVQVRVLNPRGGGSYHPKVYLARHGERVRAAIGSANLTGGLIANHEAVVTLEGPATALTLDHLWTRAEAWWAHSDAVAWQPATMPAPAEVLPSELLSRLRAVFANSPVVVTLAESKPNTIVEITPDGVWVETERTRAAGRPAQLVDAWMITIAWEWLVAHGSITNTWLVADEGLNVKRSSFVCALLARFPDVRVKSTRPITLELGGQASPLVAAAEAPAPSYIARDVRELVVPGEPIGGEDTRTKAWRRTVAVAAAGVGPAEAVRLDFVVSPSRRADLDNLVRPAIEGLQDAGVFARAYAGLDAILATRSVASPAHLRVGLRGEDVTEALDSGPCAGRRAVAGPAP